MGFVEQGNGETTETDGSGIDGGTPGPAELLDDTRAAMAAELAGPAATGPLLDDASRRLFLHRNYSRMDHMGG